MRFIAIDLGTQTGYSVWEDAKYVTSGHITLPTTITKDGRAVIGRQYIRLKKLIEEHKCEMIAYEMTDWHLPASPKESFQARAVREKRNRQVQRSLGRKEAMCEAAAFELGMKAQAVTVHQAKRALTKNGNASKELVAKKAREVFGTLIADDATQDQIDSFSIAAAILDDIDINWRITIRENSIEI